MPDREKVIKGLEVCTSKPCYCTDCPYKANCCLDSQEVMEDALALLKEQEAVVPCKDCKHCYFASNRIPCEQTLACGKHGMDITPDWFCADGVKKDD